MTVADFIIRIKNGYMAKRDYVEVTYSKMNETLLAKLKALQYIVSYEVIGDVKKKIMIKLRYEDGVPALTDVKIFSTPGRRWYTTYKDVKPVLGGMGTALVSTSKGAMTVAEVKKHKIGGELLFEIW